MRWERLINKIGEGAWLMDNNWKYEPVFHRSYHFNKYDHPGLALFPETVSFGYWKNPDSRKEFARDCRVAAERFFEKSHQGGLTQAKKKTYREFGSRRLGMGMHALQDVLAHGNLWEHLSAIATGPYYDATGGSYFLTPYERDRGLTNHWREHKARVLSGTYLRDFRYFSEMT